MKATGAPQTGEMRIRKDCAISVKARSRMAIRLEPGPGRGLRAEIEVGPGAEASILLAAPKHARVEALCRLGAGSSLCTASVWEAGGRGIFRTELAGKGAFAQETHVFAARGDERISLDTQTSQLGASTKAHVSVRGAVFDSARADVRGMMAIGLRGAGSEALLDEHVLLMGEASEASAKPGLEIENNDVSAKHSSSVSRPAEGKLFYLMSRGIARAEAETLVAAGFLAAAAERVQDPACRAALLSGLSRVTPVD